MQSTFAWLDHSETQRRQMMEVVGLFREKGTLDELGIGAVRDALSELLFPGTSTLHTRAKYLLFVPWIMLGMERDGVSSRAAAERLKRDEIRLIYALKQGDAGEGIIGVDAREHLSQFPSAVYWSALGRYGIRQLPTTRAQYLGALDAQYVRRRRARLNDDGEVLDPARSHWHPAIPPAPDGLLDEVTFALSPEEADYLVDRMLDRCAGTYLAHLLTQPEIATDTSAPWAHPAAGTAPDAVVEPLRHAEAFSTAVQGARLLYSLILAEKIREARTAGGRFVINVDAVDEFRGLLNGYRDTIAARIVDLQRWDRRRFWQIAYGINPRIPLPTRGFIERWIDIVLSREGAVADDQEARRLVEHRERAVKRSLARVDNPRALDRWSAQSGTRPLTFRWTQVRRMVTDIVDGRAATPEAAVA